jgi:hypothetical protein
VFFDVRIYTCEARLVRRICDGDDDDNRNDNNDYGDEDNDQE